MAERLSPIFTDNTAWPSTGSSESNSDEEMEIDSDHMTISQQCQRFERDMIWSPIQSPAPSSMGTCDMPTQQSPSQNSVIVVESDDEVPTTKKPDVHRVCLMSPDMFADSQELASHHRRMDWRPNAASSEELCGQQVMHDVEMMECIDPEDTVDMRTGETIAAIAATIHLLSDVASERGMQQVPINKVLMETTTESYEEPLKVQPTHSHKLIKCKPTNPMIHEYEAPPTQEELNAFRKRLVSNDSEVRCPEACSPIAKRRKIVKATIPTHTNAKSTKIILNGVNKPSARVVPPLNIDDTTFCISIVEPTQNITLPSACLSNITHLPTIPTHPILRTASMATSSDQTFCSLVELQNTQKHKIDSEPFDIDAAIQNLMHLNADKNSTGICETSLNDSGHATPPPETSRLAPHIESASGLVGDEYVTVLSQRSTYLAAIERIVLQFLLDMVACDQSGRVTLAVQRSSWQSCSYEPLSQTLGLSQQSMSHGKIISRSNIMQTLGLLNEIYCRLQSRQSCTQRELYYNDPELYQDMRKVSSVVENVSSMIGAMPWELGVFSTSSGLMAGPITVTLENDELIDCSAISGGIVLPNLTTGIKSINTTAELVLLVEKDTVYQKLLSADLMKLLGKQCIIMTSKGYPQINTRVMLHKIWSHCRLPMFVMCDADPHGIEIMLIYRHGSMNMSRCVDHLAVPAIQWIGLRPSDISRLGLPTLPLTAHDQKWIQCMLQRPYISETICMELQILMQTNRKAEIESLAILSSGYLVEEYLPKHIGRKIK